jgi:flagellar motor protein MotB
MRASIAIFLRAADPVGWGRHGCFYLTLRNRLWFVNGEQPQQIYWRKTSASQFSLAKLRSMSAPPHGDDDNFFAENPKSGDSPVLQGESPRTVVTSMSSRLPPKAWVAVGAGVVLLVGLGVVFAATRNSGPKGAPDLQELSVAQAQVAKLEAEVKDLNAAMGLVPKSHVNEGNGIAGASASAEESRLVQEMADSLSTKLTKEVEKGDALVSRDGNVLTLVLADKLVFEPDVDDISDSGEAVLRHVGNVIARVRGRDIQVRSFTDTKPIPGENEERYSSNWELSALRATQVVRFFQDESNIDPNHLVAMSFGQYHPPPEGADHKKRVRRIEVVIPAVSTVASAPKRNLE